MRLPVPASLFLALSLAVFPLAACGTDDAVEPAEATSCVELARAGRAVAEQVLERLAGQTMAELEAADPDNPMGVVERLMRTDEFERRAGELGCGRGELEVAACLAYQGLEQLAEGELAREYLAPYFTACG